MSIGDTSLLINPALWCLVTWFSNANLHSSNVRLNTKQDFLFDVSRTSDYGHAKQVGRKLLSLGVYFPLWLEGMGIFVWSIPNSQVLTRTELQTIIPSETLMLVLQSGSSPSIKGIV